MSDLYKESNDISRLHKKIDVQMEEIERLREALLAVSYAAHELCVALNVDTDETVICEKNFLTDKVVAQKSLADIFAQVAAALEGK